jgi:RNA polymerase sigma factor (TIGR02999 family)
MARAQSAVTQLLADARNGDRAALDKLMPVLYQELRRLAKRQMLGQAPGHSLQTTDLIHQAYLKLVNIEGAVWKDRIHFLSVASRAMRSVLVDHARRRRYAKRGGNPLRVSLDDALLVSEQPAAEVLAVDEALRQLTLLDPRKSQIVEHRYFGGLTVEETADVLGVSPITVHREWVKARAWLYEKLRHGEGM